MHSSALYISLSPSRSLCFAAAVDTMATQNEERRALYMAYMKCCNAHDFAGMTSYYANPININDEPWDASKVTDQFQPLVDAFPDWHWEIRNLNIDGDYLALHLRITGTHKGTFQGIEPTGCRVSSTQFTLYHLVNGKFVDVWDMTDMDTVMKQLREAKGSQS